MALFDVADLDGDGLPDIVLVSNSGGSVRVMRNLGGGAFTSPVITLLLPSPPTALRCGDITGNGLPDVAVLVGNGTGTDLLWSANTDGILAPFTQVTNVHDGPPGPVLLLGDLDQQGGQDLVLQVPFGPLLALRNTAGNGSTWTEATILFFPTFPFTDPQLLDVDGDGDLDVVDASTEAVQWARNPMNAGGPWTSFTNVLLATGANAGPGRFGRPGCGDAAVVFAPGGTDLPLRWSAFVDNVNAFVHAEDIATAAPVGLVMLADLDGDGRDDLVTVNADGIFWQASTLVPTTLELTLPPLDTLCTFGPLYALPDVLPAGGRWSGPGVVDNAVDRGLLVFAGNYPMVHAVYPDQGCPAAAARTLRLIDNPTVLPNLGAAICSGAPPIAMSSIPANTTWDGLTSGNILDPAQLVNPFFACIYEDPTGSTCVTVIGPVLIWNTLPAEIGPVGPFCVNSGLQTIVPLAAPPSGITWSGDIFGAGPGTAFFNPAMGPGTYTIIMQSNPVGSGQCANSDTVQVVVSDDIPVVTLPELPGAYCTTGGSIALEGALPEGGSWSGPGVSGAVLDPAAAGAGMHQIAYSITAATGCTGFGFVVVEVADTALVFWPGEEDLVFCRTDDPVQFTASPAGGSWGEPLDATGLFSPSLLNAGNYALTYTYTGPNGCTLTSTPQPLDLLNTTVVSITGVEPLCVEDAPVAIAGTPAGIWSGAVSGEGSVVLFDPAAIGIGTWTVFLDAAAPGECAGRDSIEVVVRSCAGIAEVDEPFPAVLAPNPFSQGTWLITEVDGLLLVDVLDAAGRSVQTTSVAAHGRTTIPLDLHGLANGTYTIRLVQADRMRHLRAVKAE